MKAREIKKMNKHLIIYIVMAHLDHKGPEGLGPRTGRGLGNCRKQQNESQPETPIGMGMGHRRHAGGGQGQGKRLKYKQSDR
jgi:hypothetical protein